LHYSLKAKRDARECHEKKKQKGKGASK